MIDISDGEILDEDIIDVEETSKDDFLKEKARNAVQSLQDSIARCGTIRLVIMGK